MMEQEKRFVMDHDEQQQQQQQQQRPVDETISEELESELEPEIESETSLSSCMSFLNTSDNDTLSSATIRSTSSSGDSSTNNNSSGEISHVVIEAAAVEFIVGGGVDGGELTKERRKCVGRNSIGSLNWGITSVIGRRKEMEDAVSVIPGFMSCTCEHVGGCTASGTRSSGEVSPVHFFGVYDGHGGAQVAKFCSERMHKAIAQEWDEKPANGFEWQSKWESVFFEGFKRADNEIGKEEEALEMVGSTAVVVVLSGCQIITSNCGDSRALLCRGTQAIPLTVDQKPDREDELKRTEGEGGKVINWNGARVFGVLAMSRAIGDWYLRPWIIPVPEITFMTRSDEDECLILASDGLWDVMTNKEVGDLARKLLRRHRRSTVATNITPAQAVADTLTEIAVSRNSSDNISIIVVDLKTRRTSKKSATKGNANAMIHPCRDIMCTP